MRWTPDMDERLAKLLRAGKSAKEIGHALGVSANAVSGRVKRNAGLAEIGFARAKAKVAPPVPVESEYPTYRVWREESNGGGVTQRYVTLRHVSILGGRE